MGGQKFQYDESGATFFYFLLSFLAIVLIPVTAYYWPRKQNEDPELENKQCQCPPCISKKELLKNSEPWRGPKNFFKILLIIFGWIVFFYIAYKVSQFEYELANFDPYEILGISATSSQSEIKRAYRKLSVILHPDKETGNEKEFMKLSKAYQALTDEESRRNWEKYGNPDGPGVMNIGIALPSWIVDKENSFWVLGLYALVFMVALPVAVGTWWYRSIRFSGDKVLLDTTQMYYFFFHKTPNTDLKRIIMILAASYEFDKKYNSEIVERQSDNEEIPALIKSLKNLHEKNKERPLCFIYSIKARAILHAHLQRIPLNPLTLEQNRRYIVAKCPYLLQEQVNCVTQLILLAYARRIQRLPTIESVENVMKLCPMIVQGLKEFKSPLMQLPYINDDNIKYFISRKRNIKSLQQFAQMKGEERRTILNSLTDDEYNNVMRVLGDMPYIDFQIKFEVMDDEKPTEVTAGAIVTVTVTLVRKNMSTLFGDDTIEDRNVTEASRGDDDKEGAGDAQGTDGEAATKVPKPPAWMKQRKGFGKKSNKKAVGKKASVVSKENQKKPEESPAPSPSTAQTKEKRRKEPKDIDADSEDSDSAVETNNDRSSDDDVKLSNVEDDDKEWDKLQKRLHKREKVLEGRSKASHSVHCPLFPLDKQEYWWTYICDRKSKTLLSPPYHITSLVDTEECQLKFSAPTWTGVFTISICLKSDSYIGLDQQRDIKLDVKEAPAEVTEHPQWEFEDSEQERGPAEGAANDSEYTTDEDLPDDDDD